MRIISDHHDYYDCIQAEGQDRTCTWVRHLEECVFEGWPFPGVRSIWKDKDLWVREWIIGFCGKIYPVLGVSKGYQPELTLCHSVEDVANFVHSNYKKSQVENFESRKPPYQRKGGLNLGRDDFEKFFQGCEDSKGKYQALFIENACPVFVACYRPSSASLNCSTLVFHGRRDREKDPYMYGAKVESIKRIKSRGGYYDDRMLKDLEFYKHFPTQQAFQELHMYLGGVLGFNNPHVPVPDDKTMRDIKGFDNMSFKKEPGKKKKKKVK